MLIKKQDKKGKTTVTPVLKVLIGMGIIIFLLYSTILIGEFSGRGLGKINGFFWAIQDIFTVANFIIAIISSIIGYFIFKSLLNSLKR